MDTVVKFRTTSAAKAELERIARARGVTVSRLLRQAAGVASRGLLVDDAVLHDLLKVRELANAALVAVENNLTDEAAARVRTATTDIHDLANRYLRGAQ